MNKHAIAGAAIRIGAACISAGGLMTLAAIGGCTSTTTAPSFNLSAAIADASLIIGTDNTSGLSGVLAMVQTAMPNAIKPSDASAITAGLTSARAVLAAMKANPPNTSNAQAGITSVLMIASDVTKTLASSGVLTDPKIALALQAVGVLMPVVEAIVTSGAQPPAAVLSGMPLSTARAMLAHVR